MTDEKYTENPLGTEAGAEDAPLGEEAGTECGGAQGAEDAPLGTPSVAPAAQLPKTELLKEVLPLAFGEIIVSALTVLVLYLLRHFGVYEVTPFYTAVTGVLLGSAVIVFNMVLLILNVNSAIDKYLALRGTGEMTEEEAEKFARENSVIIQNAMMKSFITRMLLVIGVSVGALLLPKAFNVIGVVVPLLAYRPIMYFNEILKKRRGN